MQSRIGVSLVVALLGCVGGASTASAQVVERDTKVTGPKGRTIERSIRTQRGPGFVDRQVEIKRPGETLIRDTRIQQPGGFGPRSGFYPGPYRRPIVEREVIVERAPLLAPFVAPFLSFSFGSPPSPPPPPPVVVVPEPVYVYPPPVVATAPVVVPGPVYEQAPPQVVQAEPPISPQVADAMGRLSSFHHQSRRDGALTLGHLGDPRAVSPLMDRLEHDLDREVRTAAAWSLGEIADPRAALVLEKASLYDKRQEVREAAKTAYRRLPKPGQQPVNSPTTSSPVITSQPAPSATSRPVHSQSNSVSIDPGPTPTSPNDMPPPPPTPEPALDPPQ